MLMLPSANRLTKETLRMFKDSGGYDAFFPPDDDPAAHAALLQRVPNLDTFEQATGFWGRQIKTSLGNTLRLLHPLVILDEGHKAYSAGARATLEGFNPSVVVELSATPPEEFEVGPGPTALSMLLAKQVDDAVNYLAALSEAERERAYRYLEPRLATDTLSMVQEAVGARRRGEEPSFWNKKIAGGFTVKHAAMGLGAVAAVAILVSWFR